MWRIRFLRFSPAPQVLGPRRRACLGTPFHRRSIWILLQVEKMRWSWETAAAARLCWESFGVRHPTSKKISGLCLYVCKRMRQASIDCISPELRVVWSQEYVCEMCMVWKKGKDGRLKWRWGSGDEDVAAARCLPCRSHVIKRPLFFTNGERTNKFQQINRDTE